MALIILLSFCLILEVHPQHVSLPQPSSLSLPATVTVLDEKPKMSVSYDSQYEEFTAVCEIPLSGSVRADFRCNLYTGHLLYLKGESRRGRSGEWICIFTSSKTDLLNRLQSVESRELSCDYSLNSDPSVRSPMSDTYDISSLIPVPTQPIITEEKSTAGTLLVVVLSVISASAVLVGVVIFLCSKSIRDSLVQTVKKNHLTQFALSSFTTGLCRINCVV
ncbi:uncharacterized protein LOC118799826 isoform X3 [Colossoma macropomum]|uniref:uncharacterized protein LOC118799826 isoform X3 n=1 Tax=Colossoma macropomum TaxID=42526 RepID=UPI00186431AF|nr:uncharacterized protein LOC118799826 isoform X3 [Colossoma macropomum]